MEFGTVGGHSIVYVDTENGTLNNNCWKGGSDLPCRSLELALEGAKEPNIKVAILLRKSGIFGNTTVMPANEIRNSDIITNNNTSCPPWLVHSPSNNGTCECRNTFKDIIRCNESLQESSILDCYCTTYDESTGTVMGACYCGCLHSIPRDNDHLYILLPHSYN